MAIARSTSQPAATPTPLPSTNHRHTGRARQPHTVGASPPTATRFSPTASSGCTRVRPRLEHDDRAGRHGGDERRHRQPRPPRRRVSFVSLGSLAPVAEPSPLVEGQRRSGGHVQRVRAPRHRDPHPHVAGPHRVLVQTRPLGADQDRHLVPRQRLPSPRPASAPPGSASSPARENRCPATLQDPPASFGDQA